MIYFVKNYRKNECEKEKKSFGFVDVCARSSTGDVCEGTKFWSEDGNGFSAAAAADATVAFWASASR